MTTTRWLVLALASLTLLPSSSLASDWKQNLRDLSLEDLMSIEIVSASRKEQRALDAAAAVFVITNDDIRRSGMTSVPELLRLAPGVQVAQINANKWAVSVRGFNGLYSNKLLVLVDGRSIYNRLYSGVLWDAEDLVTDDIDRIEVIRGPSAAAWGANAVNGVINIVTKGTADTRGGLVRVDAGNEGTQGVVRYGGTLGTATFRIYTQWTGRGESLVAPDVEADDGSHSLRTGFRLDHLAGADAFSVESVFNAGEAHALWRNLDPATSVQTPYSTEPSNTLGGHLLGRWTRTRRGGATLQVQSFVDVASRQETIGDYHRSSLGLDGQYHTPIGQRQDLVTGVGFRFVSERLGGHTGVALTPPSEKSALLTGFVLDEISLIKDRLTLTLGSQVQYDSYAGGGVQPTARVMWKVRPRQRLWGAVSRALRTPSLTDRRIQVDYPPMQTSSGPLYVTVLGNPEIDSESFVEGEAGYRVEVGSNLSVDVTGYVGTYDDLVTQEPSAPVFEPLPSPRLRVTSRFANRLEATTRGVEVAGHWAPIPALRVDGSVTGFHITPTLESGSRDAGAAAEDGSAPRTQWQVRSSYSPVARATISAAVFHVGELRRLQVRAYTRADLNAEWRFGARLTATVIGQNLFDAAHMEFAGGTALLRATEVPRSVSARLRWTFR